jgi:hypothetical protein
MKISYEKSDLKNRTGYCRLVFVGFCRENFRFSDFFFENDLFLKVFWKYLKSSTWIFLIFEFDLAHDKSFLMRPKTQKKIMLGKIVKTS